MQATAHLLEDIRGLEEKLHRPEIRGSRKATSELLAVGFVEFGSSGTIYTRDEIIELLAQETHAAHLVTYDYALRRISADAVLLTYRSGRVPEDGSPARHVLRSSLWQYVDERWQMIFHQGTPCMPAA